MRQPDPDRYAAGIARLVELGRRAGVGWEGRWDEIADYVRSRMTGAYAVDEFGFDPEFTSTIWQPLARTVARRWFRCEVRGAANIPAHGPAMLVANHAGSLPVDGMVLQSIVHDESGRQLRTLGADLLFRTPFFADLVRRTGTTLACQADASRLLSSGHLVSVFPEGFKGPGKPFAQRYKLQRFGRGGFVSTAIAAGVPIIPVSIVGSEEAYPNLADVPFLARALGLPHFPVTPLFPWFGLLGAVPLPSKWIIGFGEPVPTAHLAGAADDPMVVFNVTDQVRESIQHSLYALLAERGPAFTDQVF
ncbi:lysophospholipid acyltransferase family protein [Propionibacteriaceae bacterium Y2011]|uniref:lysophospholipid acyltransferase family protein n=1 Tax=Microlunatus sp. Y2014 TaxID=3418488 RepID=UPI003B4C9D76